MQEINFGAYSVPLILMVALAFIYKFFEKPDGTSALSNRFKPLIAIGAGTLLGVLGLFYQGLQPNIQTITDHLLYGFMSGAAAVGLWEGYSKIRESEKK